MTDKDIIVIHLDDDTFDKMASDIEKATGEAWAEDGLLATKELKTRTYHTSPKHKS